MTIRREQVGWMNMQWQTLLFHLLTAAILMVTPILILLRTVNYMDAILEATPISIFLLTVNYRYQNGH